MTLSLPERKVLEAAAAAYPFPIAIACRRFLDAQARDPWREWEALSRDVLSPVLQYLSHLLLSDLVASGAKPAHLFHHVQSVLSRPTAGQYVGFLRETARYYRQNALNGAVPELVEFLTRSDVDCVLLPEGKPLLGLLVDYRNLWAHGRFDDRGALAQTVAAIREQTTVLLAELAFLAEHPLQMQDGTALMGSDAAALQGGAQPLAVITAGGVILRPLLLKLRERDLMLLEDLDLKGQLVYRGSSTYTRYTRRQLHSGDGARLFEELKALLEKVRAADTLLESPDWSTFPGRAALVTEQALYQYGKLGTRKYIPEQYVPQADWTGHNGLFQRFVASDRSLLAISGSQGAGKSALDAHLAAEARAAGHAVLLVNAQRFTFAEVGDYTHNPFPGHFADLLHYRRPLDAEAYRRLTRTAPPGRQVVLFIDAVNEVDGFDAKWNRFRALELLLEWICEVAQPGLKFVLSFRLDEYAKYGYLQPDELPQRLADIAWPGDHPAKPWVVDLAPFQESQARELYEKLQNRPEEGMAPAMSWDELHEGLGAALPEFTANPLLFQLFLRSHHLKPRVETNDKDAVFTRYAQKLTEADELRHWPWWKRALGFLRNGNLTARERFVADLSAVLVRHGALAVIPERLDARRATERHLLRELNRPESSVCRELVEGGLLSWEAVDAGSGHEPIRRLSLVAELLSTVMNGLYRKRLLRDLVRGTAVLSLVVASVWLGAALTLWTSQRKSDFFLGSSPGAFLMLAKGLPVVLSGLLAFVAVMSHGVISVLRTGKIRSSDPFTLGLDDRFHRESLPYIVLALAAIILPTGAVLGVTLSHYSLPAIVAYCIALFGLLYRMSADILIRSISAPERIKLRRISDSFARMRTSPYQRAIRKSIIEKLLVAGAWVAAVVFVHGCFGHLTEPSYGTTFREYEFWKFVRPLEARQSDAEVRLVLFFILVLLIFSSFSSLYSYLTIRRLHAALKNTRSTGTLRRAMTRVVIHGYAWMSLILLVFYLMEILSPCARCSLWNCRFDTMTQSQLNAYLSAMPEVGRGVLVEGESIRKLVIADDKAVSDEFLRALRHLESLRSIHLPARCGLEFDVSRLPSLTSVAGPSAFRTGVNPYVWQWEITAACKDALDFREAFPSLGVITLQEPLARELAGKLRPPDKSFILQILSEEKDEALRFDWLVLDPGNSLRV